MRKIPFAKLLDRGWPDYSYPALQAEALTAYRAFLKSRGVGVERFRPGKAGQIALLGDAARYSEFEIRNIVANGEVWTGAGEGTRSLFPPYRRPGAVSVTDLRPSAKTVIGQRATRLAGPPGHIVIRVEPGGKHYSVYVLDNSDDRDLIRASVGPLTAGQRQ